MKCRKCLALLVWIEHELFSFSSISLSYSLSCLRSRWRTEKRWNQPKQRPKEQERSSLPRPLPRRQWNRSGCSKCLVRDGVFTFVHSPGFDDVFIGPRCSAYTSSLAAGIWSSSRCSLLTLLTDSTTHGWNWSPWLQLESVPSERREQWTINYVILSGRK
jgi:hypothetical protein